MNLVIEIVLTIILLKILEFIVVFCLSVLVVQWLFVIMVTFADILNKYEMRKKYFQFKNWKWFLKMLLIPGYLFVLLNRLKDD
jgi:hypothetical protein